MKKTSITILFLFGIFLTATAQPFVDLLNTKYQYYPSAKYNDGSSDKVSSTQWLTSVLVPLEKKNKDVVLIGFDYQQTDFTISGAYNYTSQLSGLDAYLGYNKQWKNEKWKTLAMFISKVNAKFSEATSGDYQWGGAILFDYKKKENLRYHFGLYYNKEYFGDFFIPLLGIDWKINDKLNLFGDLPNVLTLERKISNKFYFGLIYTSNIASFRPGSSIFKSDYVREGDKLWGHNELKAFFDYYISNHFVIYAQAGRTIGRYFQLYRGEDKIDLPVNAYRKTADSFLVSGGIAFRFRIDEKK